MYITSSKSSFNINGKKWMLAASAFFPSHDPWTVKQIAELCCDWLKDELQIEISYHFCWFWFSTTKCFFDIHLWGVKVWGPTNINIISIRALKNKKLWNKCNQFLVSKACYVFSYKIQKKLTIDVRPVFEKGFPISNCISFKLIGAKTAVKLQFRFVPAFDNVNRLLSSVTKTLHAEMER